MPFLLLILYTLLYIFVPRNNQIFLKYEVQDFTLKKQYQQNISEIKLIFHLYINDEVVFIKEYSIKENKMMKFEIFRKPWWFIAQKSMMYLTELLMLKELYNSAANKYIALLDIEINWQFSQSSFLDTCNLALENWLLYYSESPLTVHCFHAISLNMSNFTV